MTRPNVPFLDLHRQHAELGPAIELAMKAVLDSGHFVLGQQVARFEEEFASFVGTSFAVGVASGTDALELGLVALGIGAGDEVVTVANAGAPTICAIRSTGATPVLADVDPLTLTLDPASAEACLTARTRALLPVHLYGQCADLTAITGLARRRGLRVVEDCAQAHGATFNGRGAGSFGDVGCFSFYPTKNLGGIGDGGMVVTGDAGIARTIRQLRMYGEASPRHSVNARGRNSRLDELQAAILRVKLPRLAGWNARRRDIAGRYNAGLATTRLGLPHEAEGRTHVYHLYVVRSAERDLVRSRMKERGVETLVHYERPVYRHEAFLDLAGALSRLPETERAVREVLSLPLYPELTDAEVEAVIEAVHSAS